MLMSWCSSMCFMTILPGHFSVSIPIRAHTGISKPKRCQDWFTTAYTTRNTWGIRYTGGYSYNQVSVDMGSMLITVLGVLGIIGNLPEIGEWFNVSRESGNNVDTAMLPSPERYILHIRPYCIFKLLQLLYYMTMLWKRKHVWNLEMGGNSSRIFFQFLYTFIVIVAVLLWMDGFGLYISCR